MPATDVAFAETGFQKGIVIMTRIFMSLMLAVAVLVAPVTGAHAQDKTKDRHIELQKFEQNGGKVEYMGYKLGLDSWLLTKADGTVMTVYTTKEGGMVVGTLVDTDGSVATMGQMASLSARQDGAQDALQGALLPESSATRAERFYAEIENKSAWGESGAKDASI